MKPSEAAVLLSTIARTDKRTVGESEARSWADLMTEADVPLADAVDAVKHHFGSSRDYLMPIHIIERVRQVRRERLLAAGTPPIPGDLSQQQERIWRRRWCELVKAGQSSADAASLVSGEMHLPEELPAVDRSTALRQLIQGSKGVTR